MKGRMCYNLRKCPEGKKDPGATALPALLSAEPGHFKTLNRRKNAQGNVSLYSQFMPQSNG
jgi:hypothetical protein